MKHIQIRNSDMAWQISKPLNKLYLPVSQQKSTNPIQLIKCKQLPAKK